MNKNALLLHEAVNSSVKFTQQLISLTRSIVVYLILFPQHCRQPLSFLTFFHGHGTDGGVGVDALPAGAYMMPTGCEYCGGPDARLCTVECQRPAFYFQKKRPPFCKSDELLWNPLNDHAIPPKPKSLIASLPRSTHLPFEGSWVSGLFGRNSNGVSSPTRT